MKKSKLCLRGYQAHEKKFAAFLEFQKRQQDFYDALAPLKAQWRDWVICPVCRKEKRYDGYNFDSRASRCRVCDNKRRRASPLPPGVVSIVWPKRVPLPC